VLSRSPSTLKSDVFRPASRTGSDLTGSYFQSEFFDPRSRTGGDGSVREYSNTYESALPTGATAVVEGFPSRASTEEPKQKAFRRWPPFQKPFA
jgi:hypothetical protein